MCDQYGENIRRKKLNIVKADTEKFQNMFTDLRIFLKSFFVHVMRIILTIKDTANIAMSITFNSLESRILSFELVLAVGPETSNNMIKQFRTCFSVVIRSFDTDIGT